MQQVVDGRGRAGVGGARAGGDGWHAPGVGDGVCLAVDAAVVWPWRGRVVAGLTTFGVGGGRRYGW